MNVETINELETVADGMRVLLHSLPASKVARLLSLWNVGQGDYLSMKASLFKDESIDSIYASVATYEKPKSGR